MDSIKIVYYGHSCFAIEVDHYRIIIDPYDGHVPGYRLLNLTANKVLCSHEHADHNYREGVILEKLSPNPFQIELLETDHDEANGSLRGKTYIHILKYKKLKLIHFGDIGRMISENEYNVVKNADCVMIPVGGTYTIDGSKAAEIVKKIHPKVTIPMHYKCGNLGLEAIHTMDEFMDNIQQDENVMIYHDNTILINEETIPQVAVLEYHS